MLSDAIYFQSCPVYFYIGLIFVIYSCEVLPWILSTSFRSGFICQNCVCIMSVCFQLGMEINFVWIFQEPSLFAVAKLLETGLVNLPRVEVLWRPLTNHLLEVCQHPHIRMREWGVEAVTYLVKAALQHKYQPPLRDNQVRRHQFILYSSFYSKIQYFLEVLEPLTLQRGVTSAARIA